MFGFEKSNDMEWITSFLLTAHIVAGFLSLLLFWIPMLAKKGGDLHKKVGRWYLLFMWIVVSTAAILSFENLMTGQLTMGIFLGFISFITANPLWHGIGVLKHGMHAPESFRTKHLVFRIAIALLALSMVVYGIVALKGEGAAILMFLFGALGLADTPRIIRELRGAKNPVNPIREHLVDMCTTGIAAYTAFFVFGANQYLEMVLTGYWMVLPWIAPTVVGSILISRSTKKYPKPARVKG
jgi:hypothetical protein